MHFPLISLISMHIFAFQCCIKEVIGELMAVRRNLTATLASLYNTTAMLDDARSTIAACNISLLDNGLANLTIEIGLYSGYAAVGLTGMARLAWLQWRKTEVFPLDRYLFFGFTFV